MIRKSKPKENKEEFEKKEKLSAEEFEKKVIELSKEGLTSEKIGETLRKQGAHSKDYNKKISKILKERSDYENPDLKNLKIKLERIKNHYEKNRQDKRAMREKDGVLAQLRKTNKYFEKK